MALAAVTAAFYPVLAEHAAAVAATLPDTPARPSDMPGADRPGEDLLDAGTWVFDPDGAIVERPPENASVPAAVQALAGVQRITRTEQDDLAIYALPVGPAAHRTAVVVAAQPRRPYEDAEHTALTAALALDGVVIATMAALTWRTVSAALAPVSRMTATAATWNAQDLDQRFRLGPATDELTTLASTLDGLLDRLAASLGHERRLTAEIAHELRTPLARMRTEAEVALRGAGTPEALRAALSTVVDDTELLTTTVDALLRSATDRSPAEQRLSGGCALAVAVHRAARQIAGPDVSVTHHIDHPDVVAAAEPELVVRILAPLLHNAARYGRGRVTVTVTRQDSQALITLDDDGPGLTPDDCLHAFTPGRRGSAAADPDGVGLGLALARRLARSADGDVDARPATVADPGGHFEVRLPLLPQQHLHPLDDRQA